MLPYIEYLRQEMAIWEGIIPEALQRESPVLLLNALHAADVPSGVNQAQIREQIGLYQSRTSKLILKLRSEGWVEDVGGEVKDGRVRPFRTSAKARQSLSTLELALAGLANAPESKKRKRMSASEKKDLARYASMGSPVFGV